MPGRVGTSLYGIVVGLISTLMGIGGGAVSNLILTLNGKDVREAVSTSAGVGGHHRGCQGRWAIW